ncbi:MAG: 50S ribosomal protein L6 [Clostridiales bacterium]|jgi:large subunit ribosomal protein L6|nr:50S ribosomal protein L6 [Clostridiales bacterium]
MSRIGKLPVVVPAGVTVTIAEGNEVTVKGPKGELSRKLAPDMNIALEDGKIIVTRPNDLKRSKSLHGLTRSLINNMVEGVTNGYTKKLEIVGTGWRVHSKEGNKLTLSLGYSHPVVMIDPDGVTSTSEAPTKITVTGIDKEKVGQYAAEIRSKRPPEPYNGKGVKYANEQIIRKAGKTGKK